MKNRTVSKYYAFLSKSFPVLCATGGLRYLPAAREATARFDLLEDFSSKSLRKITEKLQRFRDDFRGMATSSEGWDKARARALALNADSLLLELTANEPWKRSPDLYLRTAFDGIRHALEKPCDSPRKLNARLAKRLKAVPGLLGSVSEHIEAVTGVAKGTAQGMTRDCARYVNQLAAEQPFASDAKLRGLLEKCLDALRDFDRFITSRPVATAAQGPPLEDVLRYGLGTDTSVEDIHAIAKNQWRESLEALESIAAESFSGRNWRTVLAEHQPEVQQDPREAFGNSVESLRGILSGTAFPGMLRDRGLAVRTPPPYALSLNLTAFYEPPGTLSGDPATLFVHPSAFDPEHGDRTKRLRAATEYRHVAAGLGYPGSHLLETVKLSLDDPVLGQVRNPLAAWGWRAFAETIPERLGVMESPYERLLLHRRLLRRAASAMIETGLHAGGMEQDKCVEMLEEAGYGRDEALRVLRSIMLEPGERIASVLGRYELEKLYGRYAGGDLVFFCRTILECGESPFDLAESALRTKAF
ncbi:DUF885 family protein [Salidesulfovibrio brasiliensis]|uniref:DUF885 family protein n=1 Tax=Salidesulfovibrio brasiliensis TaxID=221711 RepID=UPI0006D0FF15|nr:DUF885 family protein [Salidesulfovibrio brasiliensis]